MTLHLFEAYGVELEYMIVDADTLSVRPAAEDVFAAAGGNGEGDPTSGEFEDGPITWSNELAAHVIELKTTEPAASLNTLCSQFSRSIEKIQSILAGLRQPARLMPTAMHPWMNPMCETTLWPHGYSDVYSKFNEVFDCRGHGWANLQSVHLNLPFHGDDEFGRLHAAIRLVLPILPAIAASSPFMDGAATGTLDNRLAVYRTNARRVPMVSGRVIPERAFTRAEYEDRILNRIYDAIRPLDPGGVLQHEWLNARGAIARFDRNAIEIRVLDIQESPVMDLAIVAIVAALVRALVEERWCPTSRQMHWEVEPLVRILDRTIQQGENAVIDDEAFLALFGWGNGHATAGTLWKHIVTTLAAHDPSLSEHARALNILTSEGTLATRLLSHARAGHAISRAALESTYRAACDCLPTSGNPLPRTLHAR
jgi:glutamate---cysteine ligase / carboxylate-amine ligase